MVGNERKRQEIEKAEAEQEHAESLEKTPRKETEEKPTELDELVKREAENLEEEKKTEKVKIGKIYGHPVEENKDTQYQTYTPYENKQKEIKIEFTSTTQTPLKLQETNLAEENIKKTTELYKHKKKGEEHGH